MNSRNKTIFEQVKCVLITIFKQLQHFLNVLSSQATRIVLFQLRLVLSIIIIGEKFIALITTTISFYYVSFYFICAETQDNWYLLQAKANYSLFFICCSIFFIIINILFQCCSRQISQASFISPTHPRIAATGTLFTTLLLHSIL